MDQATQELLAAARALGQLYVEEQRALSHNAAVNCGRPLDSCPPRSAIAAAERSLREAYRNLLESEASPTKRV